MNRPIPHSEIVRFLKEVLGVDPHNVEAVDFRQGVVTVLQYQFNEAGQMHVTGDGVAMVKSDVDVDWEA